MTTTAIGYPRGLQRLSTAGEILSPSSQRSLKTPKVPHLERRQELHSPICCVNFETDVCQPSDECGSLEVAPCRLHKQARTTVRNQSGR